MEYAPIIIFAFNRPNSLQNLLKSLLKNPETVKSDLFIFIDGPRVPEQTNNILAVTKIANSIIGFKSVNVNTSDHNLGLGPSIIKGVSQVLNIYEYAIILEDDLEVQPNFLSFMNQALSLYKDSQKVFSICGYTNKIKLPRNYEEDTYFCTRSSSWGWATWKDRWNSVDWKLEAWDYFSSKKKAFNKWGGSDCFGLLNSWKIGLNNSWAIRFCFAQFLQDKVSLFPIKSLVLNNGFDGYGTNCKKWSRFKYELMNENITLFRFPKEIKIMKYFKKKSLKYHSIIIRIYSKFNYFLYK